MKVFGACLALVVLSSLSYGKPVYYGMLLSAHPNSKIDVQVKCMVCHNGRAMNEYGRAFVNASLTMNKPDIFKKIAPLDSDHDGISNELEIKLGSNPGVAGK